MKTLATFRISISKCVDGYLLVKSCPTSLIHGLYSLKRRSMETSERKILAKTDVGT